MGITFTATGSRRIAEFKAVFTVLTPRPDEAPIDARVYYGKLAQMRKDHFEEIPDDGISDLEVMLSRAARL